MADRRKNKIISPEGLERIRQSKLKFWADPANRRRASRNISKAVTEAFKDPTKRKNMVEGNRRKYADPENRKLISRNISKGVIEAWNDPTKRFRDPKTLQAKSRSMKKAWKQADTSRRQAWTDAIGRTRRTPEMRARQSEITRDRWTDPDYRKRQSEARRQAWANSKSRQRRLRGLRLAQARPDVQEKKSSAMKERWAKMRSILRTGRTPKRRGGSVRGRLLVDSARKIEVIARYKLRSESDGWIAKNWKEISGDHATADAVEKFIKRHRTHIAHKQAELKHKSGR